AQSTPNPLAKASLIQSMASGSSSRAWVKSPALTASNPTSVTSCITVCLPLPSGPAFWVIGVLHIAVACGVEGLEQQRGGGLPLQQLGARYIARQRQAAEIGFQRVGGVDHHFSGKRRCMLAEQRTGGVVGGSEDNGIGRRDCFFDRLRGVCVRSF